VRELTQRASDWLSQPVGIEPVNVLIINWEDNADGTPIWTYYVDTDYGEIASINDSNPELGAAGVILELANLESLPDLDGKGSSQAISATLNDTNGSIKAIFDRTDIHKRPVRVAQWFKGIPLVDSFVLFEGRINTPIVWSEGNRQFSFDIVSPLESREVGFSIEEGAFDYAPQHIIGKAWPYVMGTAFKVPSVRIQEIPKGVTASSFRDTATHRSNTNRASRSNADAMNEALYQSSIADAHATYLGLAHPDTDDVRAPFKDDAPYIADYELRERTHKINDIQVFEIVRHVIRGTQRDLKRQAKQFSEKANEYRLQAQAAGQESLRGLFAEYVPFVEVANSDKFPQNHPTTVNISGRTYEGTFSDGKFHINRPADNSYLGLSPATRVSVQDDSISTQYIQEIANGPDFIVDGGTQLFLGNNSGYGIDYIACLDHCTVGAVYAKKRVGDSTLMWPVPAGYYSVVYDSYGPNFGTGSSYDELKVTKIVMSTPLSSRQGGDGQSEGWEDEIFCDLTSPYGNNVVDHMAILINRYTNQTHDVTSFDSVRALQVAYPVGCAILDRRDVLAVLQEMAFQARCNIRYNNGKFYLKYLAIDYPYVDNITHDDVERASLEISTGETENLVTKLVADWKLDYSGENDRVQIYRHNIKKYGTHELQYHFWMYNIEQNVHKSAVFWLIRKGNSWKRLKFNSFMTKLPLEANDYVQVTMPESHDGTVIGMVESCIYDSAQRTMTMEIWLPVRLGERIAYEFAMPAGLPSTTLWPTKTALQYGYAGTGSQAGGSVSSNPASVGGASRSNNLDHGGNRTHDDFLLGPAQNWGVSDDENVAQPYVNPSKGLSPGDISRTLGNTSGVTTITFGPSNPAAGSININGKEVVQLNTPVPVKTFVIKPAGTPESTRVAETSSVFPAKIIAQDVGNNYSVKLYRNGVDEEPEEVIAYALQIAEDETFDADTWCFVAQLPTPDGTKYYIQPAVWSKTKT
jgi:hypothetical protein